MFALKEFILFSEEMYIHARLNQLWLVLYVQKDCFEVYALVPGLLREEVCVLFNLYPKISSLFPWILILILSLHKPIKKKIGERNGIPNHVSYSLIETNWLSVLHTLSLLCIHNCCRNCLGNDWYLLWGNMV